MFGFMSRTSFRIALLVTALAWPLSAFGAVPGNVTGLSARHSGGQVSVHWEAPENDITAYRIYFGQKSILGNDGAYDDFETTSGKNTDLILSEIPPYPEVFLAVTAVNSGGEESASFIEEVQLTLGSDGDGAASKSSDQNMVDVPSPSRKQRESNTVGLLSATSQSPTLLQLTFSAPVTVGLEQAVNAFTVLDAVGDGLVLKRIVLEGNTVTLTTAKQVPGRKYVIRVNEVVQGVPSSGNLVPVDSERNIQTFTGFEGAAGTEIAASVIEPTTVMKAPSIGRQSSGGLSSSGLPIVGIAMIGGAGAGWRWMKKRKCSTEA